MVPLAFFLFLHRPQTSTLFPYTTLFRSQQHEAAARKAAARGGAILFACGALSPGSPTHLRSEEHTSELQSQSNLVCRLLLAKKNRSPVDLVRIGLAVARKDLPFEFLLDV